MSEDKENQPSLQNIADIPKEAEILETKTVPKAPLTEEERQRQKAIFAKLLTKDADLHNRLLKIAKKSDMKPKKFMQLLNDRLCDGKLNWHGVILISHGYFSV